MKRSRRFRRRYWRESIRFWLMGLALCLIVAVAAVIVRVMFETVAGKKPDANGTAAGQQALPPSR